MTKGTTSFGHRHNKSHGLCVRCGKKSYHIQKQVCSSCAYPRPTMRRFNYANKAKRRRTEGTGRMRTLKHMSRKFKNGFQTGQAVSQKHKSK